MHFVDAKGILSAQNASELLEKDLRSKRKKCMIGHCFGLDDNNSNTHSIMCQAGARRAVNTVQQCDNDAFNLKHP